MTPVEVKKLFISAAELNDPQLALMAAKELVNQDFYINVQTYDHVSKDGARIVPVQWGDKPCQASCGKGLIKEGTKAWWVKGVGVWHLDCWKND